MPMHRCTQENTRVNQFDRLGSSRIERPSRKLVPPLAEAESLESDEDKSLATRSILVPIDLGPATVFNILRNKIVKR